MPKSNANKEIKFELHERSKHRARYNFDELVAVNPELSSFVFENKYKNQTIDFANPKAVLALNKSMLMANYGVKFWQIPEGYLCPPIPGRADYIHYAADLLAATNNGNIPKGEKINILDIGMGASCIYPLMGNAIYDWSFMGSEIDSDAIKSAQNIIDKNNLQDKITLKKQLNKCHFFQGILEQNQKIDLSICNPPCHANAEEAEAGTTRKWNNLKKLDTKKTVLNFGGHKNELWTRGGERTFIKNMIFESRKFSDSCLWFTTLVSKQDHLDSVYQNLKQAQVKEAKTINMGQGQKISRIVAWTFLSKQEQNNWCKKWEQKNTEK